MSDTPKAKYSVAMIVRDCATELERCLKSFAAYPDEIVVVNTGIDESEKGFKETNGVARSFGAKIFHFPWIEDFSAARKFSFDQCSHDAVMWLDSDDTVEGAKSLDGIIRQAFGSGQCESLYLEYLYDFDKSGNCTTLLTRERVVDRRWYEWRAPIHEVLCERFRARITKVPPQAARIKHHHIRAEEGETPRSLHRNLRILEHHYGDGKKYCEERMVFYWAQTLLGMGRYEEALKKYLEYVPRSGSNHEIQSALCAASECARKLDMIPHARALAHQAIERNPEAPTPYFVLAQACLAGHLDDLARHYAMRCLESADKFQQEMVSFPKMIFGGAAFLVAEINYKQNRIDEIEPMLVIAQKYFTPQDAGIVEMRKNIATAKKKTALLTAYNQFRAEAEAQGRHQDVRSFARMMPDEIKGFPEVARYLPKTRPNDKPTVVFLCGGGMAGGWGPELLRTGIGGSEEAVCYLAEQFVKKGWHAEVYGSVQRQTWNGVEWYPIDNFSGDDEEHPVEALVVWRDPMQVLYFGVKAKKTYLWLHDMPAPGSWMPDLWNAFDGIFVLSEFHGREHSFVPDAKKVLTGNGLPLDRLVPMDQLTNEPTRMVYASDPTRGLETVLNWWEYIKAAVPTAELDVFYGFHPTLVAAAHGRDPYARNLAAQIQRIDEKRQQPGVNWLGFVGQDVLHAGMAKCGLWLYPTVFPEISCITGMKMQAHGVIPVTVNQFAMKETVRHGVKLDQRMDTLEAQRVWADEVIRLALNPWDEAKRIDMALDARATFDWSKIADQWIGLMSQKTDAPRQYARGRIDLIRASP